MARFAIAIGSRNYSSANTGKKMLLKPPIAPMEARSVDDVPAGPGWQYEPKWDGFRCIAFRNGRHIYLQSKAAQPLARYFPDIAGNYTRTTNVFRIGSK